MSSDNSVARELFKDDVEDATSTTIMEEFNTQCEANRQVGGDGSRCIGCGTPIVQKYDNKRERFHCGNDCIRAQLTRTLRADAFTRHYASPMASAVRAGVLLADGMHVILCYLYKNHLGSGNMGSKWGQINRTVVCKQKMIVENIDCV